MALAVPGTGSSCHGAPTTMKYWAANLKTQWQDSDRTTSCSSYGVASASGTGSCCIPLSAFTGTGKLRQYILNYWHRHGDWQLEWCCSIAHEGAATTGGISLNGILRFVP